MYLVNSVLLLTRNYIFLIISGCNKEGHLIFLLALLELHTLQTVRELSLLCKCKNVLRTKCLGHSWLPAAHI